MSPCGWFPVELFIPSNRELGYVCGSPETWLGWCTRDDRAIRVSNHCFFNTQTQSKLLGESQKRMPKKHRFWTGMIALGGEPHQPEPPFNGLGWKAGMASQRRNPPHKTAYRARAP